VTQRQGEALPETLGRYRISKRLGAGGMAEVFLARSTGAEGIEKVLVLKRILPSFARSAKFIAMFVDEAKLAMRLNHPNIVQVYAFEQVRSEFLLAMEFVDGLDLGRLVSKAQKVHRPIPAGIAAYVVSEVAKGLDYAHKRRDEQGEPMEIVHRDVSPQNVLLTQDGIVKIADFGIAKARLVSEETGVIKGKFAYMSPEQARGERVDARSDVYALGVLLAELLVGRSMYPNLHGLDVLERVREGQVTAPRQVNPEVSEELNQIVLRALEADPEARYQTARSLAGALARYLHSLDQVYDAEALERFIHDVLPETVRQEAPPLEAERQTLLSDVAAGTGEVRERRRVVVVAGNIHGDADDTSSRPETGEAMLRVGDETAKILGEIAYKEDAVLTWPEGRGRARFRFLLGLGKVRVSDPLKAARVAMDVREALEGLSADLLQPVHASLGISRGTVSAVRDTGGRLLRYEPVGAVLDVAERLADAGAGGEILAAGEVYRLARGEFDFDDAEERQVAVKTGAGREARGIRAHRLRGALGRQAREAALIRGPAVGFVGRDRERARLQTFYQETVEGSRTLFASLVGDLGVGKSALVADLLRTLDPKPRVLRAECTFGSSDVPYSAVATVVRSALNINDDIKPDEVRIELASALAALDLDADRELATRTGLEALVAPSRVEDGEARVEPAVIARSVELLLAAMAQKQPVFLWVDALEFCDGSSLELLRNLMQRSYPVPCFVLLSSRPEETLEPVLLGVPELRLEELPEADARALVQKGFDDAEVPEEVMEAVVERAGGNPFFLLELVEALLERGVVAVEKVGTERRVTRHPGVPIALPATLEDVIAERLDELPEGPRQVSRWLSVLGSDANSTDLSELAERPVDADIAELCDRGLLSVRSEGGVAFVSGVVRQVVYEGSDPADRVRMHRAVAQRLSARAGVAPARIARHLEYARQDAEAAISYLDAADAARAVYSNRDAMRFFARALSLLPDSSPERFRAHLGREQILRFLGRTNERMRELTELRAAAEASDNPRMRAEALGRRGRFELDGGRSEGVRALLEEALEAARQARDARIEIDTLRMMAELHRDTGAPAEALDACDQALLRAGTTPSLMGARGSVLVQRGILLRRLGRLPEAFEAYTEAIVIFRRQGITRNEAFALNSLGVALASAGDYEDAIAVIRASIRLDRLTGDRLRLGRKLSNVGQLYAVLGDRERATEFVQRALDVFEVVDDGPGRCDALVAMAEILLEGEEVEIALARRELDSARRVASKLGSRYELSRERVVRSELELLAGDAELAEKMAREAAELARQDGVLPHEVAARTALAEALIARGETAEAERTAREVQALIAHAEVERRERIELRLSRVFRAAGRSEDAAACLVTGADVVAKRAARIRDPELRERYLHTPDVAAIAAEAR